jgi:hypothetical protein
MSRILTNEIRVAREDYPCDATRTIRESGEIPPESCPEAVRELFQDLRWHSAIRKGEKYRYVTFVQDGDFCVWRERLDAGEVLREMELDGAW